MIGKKNKMSNKKMIAYGPVPSRRLGKSLGINNIPPKICTYSCIYCQLGKTINMQVKRKEFYKTEEIIYAVKEKIKKAREKQEHIDYLAFVPDGEPTLDINLKKEIEKLKPLGIKIAVITNSSLIDKKEVRDALLKSDWVSLKIDTVNKETWKKIDRPHGSLKLKEILKGIKFFSKNFKGDLVTETMMIKDINDNDIEIENTANFISELNQKISYISIPIRPPAEKWVKAADEEKINKAYQIFKERNINVEYLIGYEGNAFAQTGNIEEDILSITSVHPMKKEAVEELLKKADSNWNLIEKLIKEKKIKEVKYKENKFYMRII